MRWVEGTIERTESIDAPLERVWASISSVEKLAGIFPGIRSMTSEGEHTVWVLEEQGAGSVRVVPRATTVVRFEAPGRVRIEDARRDRDNAWIEGVVEMEEASGATTGRASLRVSIGLPIPFLLVPVARAIVQKRVDGMADRLFENVRRRLRGGSE